MEAEKVGSGMFVRVEYTGTLSNGEVFDTSRGRHPIEIRMGAGQLIKGFEASLMGMALNESKTFTLEPREAYGERDENATHDFPRTEIPPQLQPRVGETVALTTPQGQQIPAQVIHADEEKVTVDLNHPLAGKTLTFEVEVVGISATPTQKPEGCGGGCNPDAAGCGGHSDGGGCGCSD